MGLLQSFRERLFALPDVRATRIVRTVGKPERDIPAVQTARDLDAVFGVPQGTPSNGFIGIPERAVLVLLILKQIRIDRSGSNPVAGRAALDFLRALDAVGTIP